MSDELAMEFEGEVKEGLEQRAEEASLYPAGYYKAQLQDVKIFTSDVETFKIKTGERAGEDMPNPFYKVQVGNFRFGSYGFKANKKDDWTDTSEKPQTRMVKACFDDINRFDRLSDESVAGGWLVKAAMKGGCASRDKKAIVEWLKNHFVVIHWAQTKGSEKYAKRNFIISIEPYVEEA